MHRTNVHASLQPGPGRRVAAASTATVVFLALAGGLTIWTRSAASSSYRSASAQSGAARTPRACAVALDRTLAAAYAIQRRTGLRGS